MTAKSLTKTQFVSRKLPLVVIWELGRINVHVVVSMDTLNDFPLDLVFGFLPGRQTDRMKRGVNYSDKLR